MEINLNPNNAVIPDAAIQEGTAKETARHMPQTTAQEPQSLPNLISDTLRLFGIKPTANNIAMTELLLQTGLPVTNDNFRMVNQLFKLLDGDKTKVLFFLENRLQPSAQNAELLQGYAEHRTQIANLLDTLFNSLTTATPTENTGSARAQVLLHLLAFDTQAAPTAAFSNEPGLYTQPKNPAVIVPAQDGGSAASAAPQSSAALPALADKSQTQALTPQAVPLFPDITEPGSGAQQNTRAIPHVPLLTDQALTEAAKELLSLSKGANETELILKELVKAYPSHETFFRETAAEAKLLPAPASSAAPATGTADSAQSAAIQSDISKTALNILKLFTDTSVREALANALILKESPQTVKNALFSKFFINPENLNKNEFSTIMKQIESAIRSADMTAGTDAQKSASALPRMPEIADLRDNLQFTNQLKSEMYVQIPLMMNNNEKTGELYIFKDKNKKSADSDELSALVALDTENLGRFETYLVKRMNTVNIQFRLASDECERLVRENLHTLKDALKACNITVNDVRYHRLKDKFSILDKEPHTPEFPVDFDRAVFDRKL